MFNSFLKRDVFINIKSVNYFLLMLITPFISSAQCAMCRASLESTGDQKQAEALNDGILYLMAVPYLLVAVVGIIIYRMYRKKKSNTS